MLPRLHLVANDAVLADPRFAERAQAIIRELGNTVALHLRGRAFESRRLFQLAARLSLQPQAVVLINERVDVALASPAVGVQLPAGALPVEVVRALLGPDRWIGCSVHTLEEAGRAESAGADFVMAGTIFESATHATQRPQGVTFLQDLSAQVSVPVVAIGGIDEQRALACRQAGAYGVAVIRAVWQAAEPGRAARNILDQLDV